MILFLRAAASLASIVCKTYILWTMIIDSYAFDCSLQSAKSPDNEIRIQTNHPAGGIILHVDQVGLVSPRHVGCIAPDIRGVCYFREIAEVLQQVVCVIPGLDVGDIK